MSLEQLSKKLLKNSVILNIISQYNYIKIILNNDDYILITDITEPKCCEKTIIEHDFKNYKNSIIDYIYDEDMISIKGGYSTKIIFKTIDGKTFNVNCSNYHNGQYCHTYYVLYVDTKLLEFEV